MRRILQLAPFVFLLAACHSNSTEVVHVKLLKGYNCSCDGGWCYGECTLPENLNPALVECGCLTQDQKAYNLSCAESCGKNPVLPKK